jgi:hypothetical protein
MARLEREVRQKQKQVLVVQKKEIGRTMSELIAKQKKALTKMVMSNRMEASRIQRYADERARQDRVLFDQEFSRLKNAYQMSLAHVKELQSRQNVLIFNQLKDLVVSYVDEGRKNHDQFVETNQAQMLEFQKWLQEELPSQILENVSGEEGAEKNIEPDVDKLVKEIGTRDDVITKAEARIRELEGKLASRQGRTIWKRMRRASPPEPYKEEESNDPQQEIFRMIREIAHERGQIESAREEKDLPEFADSFGSRMSKKITH